MEPPQRATQRWALGLSIAALHSAAGSARSRSRRYSRRSNWRCHRSRRPRPPSSLRAAPIPVCMRHCRSFTSTPPSRASRQPGCAAVTSSCRTMSRSAGPPVGRTVSCALRGALAPLRHLLTSAPQRPGLHAGRVGWTHWPLRSRAHRGSAALRCGARTISRAFAPPNARPSRRSRPSIRPSCSSAARCCASIFMPTPSCIT